MKIPSDQPPIGIIQSLREWLTRLVININNAIGIINEQKLSSINPPMIIKGWRDVTPAIVAERNGTSAPVHSTFRDGIKLYEFPHSDVKETWSTFHIDHDYALNTAVFIHVHFAIGDSALAGNVRWGFEYSIAKGHSQGSESIFSTTSIVYANCAVDASSNYEHHIAEISIGIESAKLEPDSIIVLRAFRDAASELDTFEASVWELAIDLHYQYERYGTKNKSPNFYR